MFVTKADTLIANTKNDGRREVRFISLQVFFVWGTFTLLNLIVLTTNPRIPNDFYYILKCKGRELLKILLKVYKFLFCQVCQPQVKMMKYGCKKSLKQIF